MGRKELRKLVKKYSMGEILGAVKTSFDQYYDGTDDSATYAWKKIPGILFNRNNDNDQRYYFNYSKKTLASRGLYVGIPWLKEFIDDHIVSQSEFESLKAILKTARNWTAFKNECIYKFKGGR